MTIIETPAPKVVAPERRRLMGDAYDLAGATDADSARVLAGLTWEPMHRPLYVDLPDDLGGLDLVTKERGVVRSDTGEMFGVVGREHKILSNEEMFGFADTLLSEAGLTWADSSPFGGARADGKAPFLAFQLPNGVKVAGHDAVDTAILLSNGHVGNTAFTLTVTPIRMQCSNVVRAAITAGRKGQSLAHFTIQHSGDMAEKVKQVKQALNLTSVYMAEFTDLANRMASIEMGLADFDQFLTQLVPIDEAAGDRAKATAEDRRAQFRSNWRNTPTLDADLRATQWGAGARLRDRAFRLLAGV